MVLAVLLVALILLLILAWFMRVRIATDFIDRELARRGVEASYDVKRIGFGTQVLENLVIGDPDSPDLRARQVKVQILVGFGGPKVGLITARGVRIRGRIVDGKLSLGQLDRLLPPPSGLPFRLPDQRVDVADSAIFLATPAGPLALGLAGKGNLADGFRGQLALAASNLALGECSLARPRAELAVRVDDLRPSVRGPLTLDRLSCGDDLALWAPSFDLQARLSPALDSWRGNLGASSQRLSAPPASATGLQIRASFAGDRERTIGRVNLAASALAIDDLATASTRFDGDYGLSPLTGDFQLDGALAVQGLRLDEASLAPMVEALEGPAGTPLGPIGANLSTALVRAARGGGSATAGVRLTNSDGLGGVQLDRVDYRSRSGASLQMTGGEGLSYSWPSGGFRVDGSLALSGGGFPEARFRLAQARIGSPIEGRGRIAPMSAGSARLALGDVHFTAGADGLTRFRTSMVLDGPFSGGRVDGLAMPISGRFGPGGLAIGEGCVTARFRRLQLDDLDLGEASVPLCPSGPALVSSDGGRLRVGAELRGPDFSGRLGGSPVRLAASRLLVGLDAFTASGLEARFGPPQSATRLDIGRLSGRFGRLGIAGDFGGLSGTIAAVPFILSEGSGRWQFAAGRLDVDGGIRIADQQDVVRFHPLVSEDLKLTLQGNRIESTGWLLHPGSRVRVTEAQIVHDLGTGAGSARLDVPGLRFTPSFQPEQLTPLTLGVVALVDGSLSGEGRVEWDMEGTRSSGTFATEGMNLAAPFGPVEGLTTRIEFTDLLGLTSAPGQVAQVDLVRAGIDVYDGTVRYQLQPNYHVAVESGRWPYAGGELFLQPTVLDFSQETTKYLTFRVAGLDAARFIQQMEFSNIAATGTFDGIIPMQFDRSGGRIVGGRLEARPEGGTLSYVGELTDRDLGPYGILAFNALKSLSYDRFDLTLDGALAGEFITTIDLDGIARDPSLTTLPSGSGITEMIARRAFRQIAAIPFEFNIRIQGQFRSLIATARSFSDPTNLIQSVLPGALRDRETPFSDVQDEESEPVQ